MATRKQIGTEQLAKVLEFTLEELRKDLAVNKTTTEQIQRRFLERLEENYNRELKINLDPFITANNSFNSNLKSTIENEQAFLSRFKDDLFKNIQEYIKTSERQAEELKTVKKGINFTYIGLGLILLAVVFFYFTYSIGFKNKSDIREEYKKELIQNGQYNTQENAIFLEKFNKWIKKNPKDFEKLSNEIDKTTD
ncbi:hypothetical protein NZD85_14625 (plasmid) [Empedobacter stercoris]|uniref:hypothetical protein n=1 Tax=Empedobacter stercoris TaxID=1628248 RepID=UPI0021AF3E63|nr:hypothetical protein [Empedobacter stercoris]UWX68476.1 hypothetical protein NZD85_14625 [Empedobacter stercoris]